MPIFPLGASHGSLPHFRLVALWIQFCDGLNWSCFFVLCPVLFLLLVHKWMSFQHSMSLSKKQKLKYYLLLLLLLYSPLNFYSDQFSTFFLLDQLYNFLNCNFLPYILMLLILLGKICWLYLPQFLLIFHF